MRAVQGTVQLFKPECVNSELTDNWQLATGVRCTRRRGGAKPGARGAGSDPISKECSRRPQQDPGPMAHDAMSAQIATVYFGALGGLAALGNLTPRCFSILAITALLGMALPDSYSLMMVGCMLSCVANCFWVNPLALRPCWIAIFNSLLTFACPLASVSSSSLCKAIPADDTAGPPPSRP